MEFREYWHIIWRRRQILLPLIAVTSLASLIFNLILPPVYKTDTTVYVQAVIPPPVPGSPEYFSQDYYRTVYSEYLADDLSVIVKSKDFGDKIASRILSQYGQKVAVRDVMDAITQTKKTHRTLKITVATGSEQLTRRIGEAMDDVLRTDGWRYFTRDDRQPISLNVVDPPHDPQAPSIIRRLLDVLLHTSVALVVGVGLAFLLHYLDDRVQDGDDAERILELPVLGAIPSDGPSGSGASASPADIWAGLLPRSWRKTPAA